MRNMEALDDKIEMWKCEWKFFKCGKSGSKQVKHKNVGTKTTNGSIEVQVENYKLKYNR